MRITIEFERPRRSRRMLGLVTAAAIVLASAGVVSASHIFSDVPDSNGFHAAISAVAGAGITTGCGAGKFCPTSTISREQEAALLHRALPRVSMYSFVGDPPFVGNDVGGSVTIVVPGSNGLGIGANQFVKVEAFATLWAGCHWTFAVDDNTDTAIVFGKQTGDGMTSAAPRPRTQVATGYVFTAAPGSHTYYAKLHQTGDCYYAFHHLTMIATTYPLGYLGTDVLPPPPPCNCEG